MSLEKSWDMAWPGGDWGGGEGANFTANYRKTTNLCTRFIYASQVQVASIYQAAVLMNSHKFVIQH